MVNNPWYRLESKTSRIDFSMALIQCNAALATDLTAGMLTHSLGSTYWQVLDLFTNGKIEEIQEKLCPYLSSRPNDANVKEVEALCACVYQTSGRKVPTITYFTINRDKLFVSKTCSHTKDRRPILLEEVLLGEYLQPELLARLVRNDVASFEKLFISVVGDVFSKFGSGVKRGKLEPIAIDCIPKNVIITANGFEYFDLEYAPCRDLTKSHFIFRCVMGLDTSFIGRRCWPYESRYSLYAVICKALGVEEDVDSDINSEISFRKDVLSENQPGLRYKEIYEAFFNQVPLYKMIYRYIMHRWAMIKFNGYKFF